MKHLVLVGACFVDTVLALPRFPGEDDKLRATRHTTRRGGNGPNAVEVLAQLVQADRDDDDDDDDNDTDNTDDVRLHLVCVLPDARSSAAKQIAASLPDGVLELCLFRAGHDEPASCTVLHSMATGSRTILSHNDLPDMTTDEFCAAVQHFRRQHNTDHDPAHAEWWHFEGRAPDVERACMQMVRSPAARVSVEIENANRPQLRTLAADANVVFYSRAWAERAGFEEAAPFLAAEAAFLADQDLSQKPLLVCTRGAEGAFAWPTATRQPQLLAAPAPVVAPDRIIDAVGAGDTFIAAMLYRLFVRGETDVHAALAFAVALASRKIQQDGFQGLLSRGPSSV